MSQFISDPLSNVTNSNGAPGVPTTANFTTSGNITKINSTNSNDIVFDASDASVEITKDLVVDAPARFNQTVLAEDSLTVGSSNIFNASYNKGDSSIYTGSLNLNGDGTGYKYGVRGFNNSEIMTVDDSVGGRIGINEPNPLEKLHVNGNIRATSALLLGNPANLNSSYTGAEFPYTGVVRMNGDGTGYKYGIRGNGEQEVFTVVDNNDGRVGIGQTSPTEKLDVNGNVASLGLVLNSPPSSDAFIQMRNVNGNNNFIQARSDDNMYITPHGSTVSIGQIGVSKQLSFNGGNALGYIGSNFLVVGEGIQLAYNYDVVNNSVFRPDGTTSRMSLEYGNIRFFNSNNVLGAAPSTQTMIIDNLGQVGIGTNPTQKLDVSGNVLAVEYIVASDSRIKKNIQDVDYEKVTSDFMKIKPKTYNYIDQTKRTDQTVYGFIAQDVKEVLPYAVKEVSSFIPDIYRECDIEQENLKIIDHGLENGDIIRVSKLDRTEDHDLEVAVLDEDTIHLVVPSDQTENKDQLEKLIKELNAQKSLFVYGKQIKDLNTVIKSHIYTTNVAVTQDLVNKHQKLVDRCEKYDRLIESLLEKVEHLQQEINQLKNN